MSPTELRNFELARPHYPYEADLDLTYDGRWYPNVYRMILHSLDAPSR